MNLTWYEYELRSEALDKQDEMEWIRARKLIAAVYNTQPFMKKGQRVKETDIIRLPIDDVEYEHTKMTKERFYELVNKWKA